MSWFGEREGGRGFSYGRIGVAPVQRYLPHDNHLGLEQGSDGVGVGNGQAVVSEDDARLGFGIGWDLVAEGRGWIAETVYGVVSVCDYGW